MLEDLSPCFGYCFLQLVDLNRFYQIIQGVVFDGLDCIFIITGGEDQFKRRVFDGLQYIETGYIAQHDVQEEQVRQVSTNCGDGLLPAQAFSNDLYSGAVVLQFPAQVFHSRGFVFNNYGT